MVTRYENATSRMVEYHIAENNILEALKYSEMAKAAALLDLVSIHSNEGRPILPVVDAQQVASTMGLTLVEYFCMFDVKVRKPFIYVSII